VGAAGVPGLFSAGKILEYADLVQVNAVLADEA